MDRKKNKQAKLHIKKGDMVLVIAGDDKGKKGRVIEVMNEDRKALVEGINIVTRHTKPNAKNQQGGRIKKEAPVHISNLMYVDKGGQATRVGRKAGEDGKLVRFSKKNNDIID
jgi:large subunit ribosomal protein L24